ncbi:MAG: thiosulfate oxidation carrier protein SoxY [Gammaproteobacteria bacterium]|nr:thiosulfate oxidation carrier protein SoxY [Gammaproteobacteria bacterium]
MVNSTRRFFLKALIAGSTLLVGLGGLLKPLIAFAERNKEAFSAKTEAEAIAEFFTNQDIIPSDAIKIGVHDLVENGAVVPVEINTGFPEASSITILVEKNPNPLIANFDLSPECSGFIATRIKMAESSDIIVVVRSQKKLFSARKFVEVIEGGCG